MPYSNNITLDFVAADFKSNRPSFATENNYATNLKFANETRTLQLSNTNYGYVVFEVSYTGTLDYISVCFTDPNGGNTSVATEQYGLYRLSNKEIIVENIIKNETISGTKTYYVVVNPDQKNKSKVLNVSVALAKKGTAPSSSSITLSYECTTSLYKYETGLHVYSPYDAQSSVATLKTNLYSFIDIANWTANTVVYASPELNNPALPYYYGYGSNVYKVGGEFERSFGTQTETTVKKKLFGKPKISEITIGPKSFYNSSTTSSDACTIPFMEGVGKVREIISNSNLSQPQQYRYYMGYNSSNIRTSNDSVFTQYSFARKGHDPITGAIHALSKTLPGVVKGYNKDWYLNGWAAAASVAGIGALVPGVTSFFIGIAKSASLFFDKLIGPFIPTLITIGPQFAAFLAVAGYVAFAALLLYALYKLFFSSTVTIFREDCKQLLYHYTNKPYIVTSQVGDDTILYRNDQLTIINNGFYCDGVYYYTQTNGKIVNKELSYTNAIISDNPARFQFTYSIRPDDKEVITDFNKLVILSYISGKPLPYCGSGTTYYNQTTLTQTVNRSCCALESSASTTFTVQSGSIFSCVSQSDANNKATEKFNAMVAYGESTSNNYCSSISSNDIGEINTQFTHDLKIEDNKTTTTVFYDLREGALGVGTTLYYDYFGCQKVLDGYYGITGSTPYCTFYQTINGDVTGVFVMQNSNSTTTTTGEQIIQTTKDYTSNWFLNGTNKTVLDSYAGNIEIDRTYNPNSLYSNDKLFKGYIKTQETLEDFQVTSYGGTSYIEADTGWYKPLIDWIELDSFYYYNSETITLDILELCPAEPYSTQRGFYIIGKSSGIETSTHNEVGVEVDVYTGSTPTFYQKYTGTTSGSTSRTFFPYGVGITSSTIVSQITLTNITTPNPKNKITYVIGSSTLCEAETPGEPASCDAGMDVVFLVDYTGSMGGAIDGVKTSISSIVNTIQTESNNNYRLGLVLFDEYTSGTVSNYSDKTAYTSLPSAQRYINTGVGGKYQWITAMEMMQTNNQSSFTTQLNLLRTTNFPLGSGQGVPEPSDMGVDLVGTENFAGTFRTGVSKLIILITDATPGGNDDTYNQTDINFVNSLITPLFNQNIRVLLMKTYSGSNVLNDLATGTNGLVTQGFAGTDIITAIQEICPTNEGIL